MMPTSRMMQMMKSVFAALALALVVTMSGAQPSAAQQQSSAQTAPPAQSGPLHVDINQGNLNPMPVAIVDFLSNAPAGQRVGSDVAGVIRADLERSALFHSVEP